MASLEQAKAQRLTAKIDYMKRVEKMIQGNGSSADNVAAFEKGASAYTKRIIANFKGYEFFPGESMNPDGMVVLTE
jgi:hypothetical protein